MTITEGPPDRNGYPTQIRTETDVHGCLFRPIDVDEKAGLFEIATEVWKATCPPEPVALAATAAGEVKHVGLTYQIIGGVQPFYDLDGEIRHVAVVCRRQVG
ncbi:hypothetical protein [Mycobacterium sp. 852014-52144_SCH5372336]|uniref:hypothetical protein n=1 Tax=Mycobacterium sp. 852014-52144_SCH5372336 TaxID=1834115 RepID=UPI001E644377|nr:hypothetical protein [Mycobacterium sp. 852014-52144_SCH5372336]